MMDDLIAFITARLDEDEAEAQEAAEAYAFHRDDDHGNAWTADEIGQETHWSYQVDEHIACHDPARVLREVAAKRAIVRRCGWSVNESDQYPNGLVSPRGVLARQNLSDLAAVWNDHPGYRGEWKM